MNIILLSGGSGKRLWPLSNEVRSKQFLRLLSDENGRHESMVQRVYRQIAETLGEKNIVVATSASQEDSINTQLQKKVDIVVEPERRNTFPAIVLACAYLTSQKNADPEETVIVSPVDSYVDPAYFEAFKVIDEKVQSGIADMVLMGVSPSYPTSKYGYILCENTGDCRRVTAFREKPDEETAAGLIAEGALWNVGVYAFKLRYLQQVTKNYFSDVNFDTVRTQYGRLEKNSFDFEIVEKADSLAVVVYQGQWKDIGTWNTLTEAMNENSIGDAVMAESCVNTHVINELSIPVVAIGTENLVIAASPDGILVSDKSKSSYLKNYVENLSTRPRYEEGTWGASKVLEYSQYRDGNTSLIKQMRIEKGCCLKYCCHYHREEVWTIVNGSGFLTLDDVTSIARSGDVYHFRSGEKHGLKAITDMHIVEIQVGNELSEEDIELFEFPDKE